MEQEEVCATEGMNASVKRVGEQGGRYWTYLGASASVLQNSFLLGGWGWGGALFALLSSTHFPLSQLLVLVLKVSSEFC